jgi:hypothetical protein
MAGKFDSQRWINAKENENFQKNDLASGFDGLALGWQVQIQHPPDHRLKRD